MGKVKLIFADVDGVLNSHQWFEKQKDERNATHIQDIDPDAVGRLNRICKETGAKVVISSVWRFSHMDTLVEVFKKYGPDIEIIGSTGRGCRSCLRGNEILQWIKDNEELIGDHYYNFKDYVILDDDSDMLYWQRHNFIQTRAADGGLMDSHVEKAIVLLNAPIDGMNLQ
jgi:hypothetical protein